MWFGQDKQMAFATGFPCMQKRQLYLSIDQAQSQASIVLFATILHLPCLQSGEVMERCGGAYIPDRIYGITVTRSIFETDSGNITTIVTLSFVDHSRPFLRFLLLKLHVKRNYQKKVI